MAHNMGPSRLFRPTCEKIQKLRDGLGEPGGPGPGFSWILGPKSRGGLCPDLSREFCITLSPKKRNPTMFLNVFHENKTFMPLVGCPQQRARRRRLELFRTKRMLSDGASAKNDDS